MSVSGFWSSELCPYCTNISKMFKRILAQFGLPSLIMNSVTWSQACFSIAFSQEIDRRRWRQLGSCHCVFGAVGRPCVMVCNCLCNCSLGIVYSSQGLRLISSSKPEYIQPCQPWSSIVLFPSLSIPPSLHLSVFSPSPCLSLSMFLSPFCLPQSFLLIHHLGPPLFQSLRSSRHLSASCSHLTLSLSLCRGLVFSCRRPCS